MRIERDMAEAFVVVLELGRASREYSFVSQGAQGNQNHLRFIKAREALDNLSRRFAQEDYEERRQEERTSKT